MMGDVVDISTAEAMVAEALCMVDEAKERECAADERARSWEDRIRSLQSLFSRPQRTGQIEPRQSDWKQRGSGGSCLSERAAKQMAEKLLAAEAALADAALADAVHERSARCQAEAQRDFYNTKEKRWQ